MSQLSHTLIVGSLCRCLRHTESNIFTALFLVKFLGAKPLFKPSRLVARQEPWRCQQERIGGFVGTWHRHP